VSSSTSLPDELASFLASRGHPVTIRRIVWITHRRSRLGTCTSPTVHIAFSASQVLNLLSRSPATLPDADRADIERLIAQDHAFNAERRSQRGRPHGQRPARRSR
jgi:hypothetical protein